jgi:hypothetical protein
MTCLPMTNAQPPPIRGGEASSGADEAALFCRFVLDHPDRTM